MAHPTPAELLAADDCLPAAVVAHLAGCAACARLRGLRRPASDAAAADEGEVAELPLADAAHYAIVEELRDGTGGMGRALRAFDRRLGRTVAIKQPRGDGGAPLAALLRERFVAEARLTARLEHPAIVTVYEAGRWRDGEPFYAMRLVRGAPLARLIEQRPALADRLALLGEVIKVGEALAYAHAQGVLHRDVKPANIMVGPYGQTVLIDWGLARDRGAPDDVAPAGGAAPGVTALGIGTPHYMPPEQAAGEAPDERIDIYALGATLYHVLAGQPPFAGDAAAARAAVQDAAPRPLAELAADAPPALRACVARAMARDPAARFATMAEFVDELQRFQRGELVRSYRYGWLERLARAAQRHRAVLAVAALALVVVVGVVAQSVRRIVAERDARARAQRQAEEAYAESRGQAASLLAARTATRGDALLAALDGVAGAAAGDRAGQGLLDALAAGPPTRALDAHAGGELLVVAADGDRLVIAGTDRTLRVWGRDGRARDAIAIPIERTRALVAAGARVLACGWGPEAAWVDLDLHAVTVLRAPSPLNACAIDAAGRPITGGAAELVRWSVDGTRAATAALDAPVDAIAIAGARVLATTGAGDLWVWDGAGPRRGHGHAGTTFGLLPVGDDAALTAGFDGRVVRWRLDGAQPEVAGVLYEEPGASLGQLTVLDDDHLAVLSQASLSARVLARVGDGYALAWRAPARVVRDDRGRVLSTSDAGLLEVAPATGATVRVLGEHEPGATTITPVGDRVVTGAKSGVATLWALDSDAAWPAHRGEVAALAPGPGGAIASAGLDGRLVIHAGDDHRVALTGGAELVAVRWAAAAPRLVALDAAGVATVIAPGAAAPLARFDGGPALDVAIRDDGAAVAIAGADGVTTWSLGGPAPPALAAAGPATAVSFAGDAVITGHLGSVVRRWDAAGALTATVTLDDRPTTGVRALAVAGGALRVALRDRTVALDPVTLAERGRWPIELVAAAGPGWIGATGASVAVVPAHGPPRRLGQHAAVVTAGAVAGDRVATGDAAGAVRVIDGDGRAWTIPPAAGAPAAVTALAFAGARLIIGDARGALRVVPLDRAAGIAAACARLAAIGRGDETAHCP
ncbi:MAG: serine/threonine protein kinase [Myxococcales bacterium]|nr:serine/threonine protein kinase [Myxococcales bacterium]